MTRYSYLSWVAAVWLPIQSPVKAQRSNPALAADANLSHALRNKDPGRGCVGQVPVGPVPDAECVRLHTRQARGSSQATTARVGSFTFRRVVLEVAQGSPRAQRCTVSVCNNSYNAFWQCCMLGCTRLHRTADNRGRQAVSASVSFAKAGRDGLIPLAQCSSEVVGSSSQFTSEPYKRHPYRTATSPWQAVSRAQRTESPRCQKKGAIREPPGSLSCLSCHASTLSPRQRCIGAEVSHTAQCAYGCVPMDELIKGWRDNPDTRPVFAPAGRPAHWCA